MAFPVTILHRYPEIAFNYELSPLTVRIHEATRSPLHFATKLCAILGGVFVLAGKAHALVDAAAGTPRKPPAKR